MCRRDCSQRPNLIRDEIFDLARCGFDFAPSETNKVGESRMSDIGPVFSSKRDRSTHHSRVARVESARNVGGRQDGNQFHVVPDLVGTERLADVAIQVNPHANVSRTAV